MRLMTRQGRQAISATEPHPGAAAVLYEKSNCTYASSKDMPAASGPLLTVAPAAKDTLTLVHFSAQHEHLRRDEFGGGGFTDITP